jgi:hypothetical protein
MAFPFNFRCLHPLVNNLAIPSDLPQKEQLRETKKKQKETTDCRLSQAKARFTKHSPTSSFSKAYKPCLPTDENQLRYREENTKNTTPSVITESR